MHALRTGLTIFAITAVLFVAACGSHPEWLHGTWELAYNPAHDSEDELTFHPDGTVVVVSQDQHQMNGKYELSESQLTLVFPGRIEPIEVNFEVSPDHSRLTYHTGAYYTKKATTPP
jgi:hypothetical protein